MTLMETIPRFVFRQGATTILPVLTLSLPVCGTCCQRSSLEWHELSPAVEHPELSSFTTCREGAPTRSYMYRCDLENPQHSSPRTTPRHPHPDENTRHERASSCDGTPSAGASTGICCLPGAIAHEPRLSRVHFIRSRGRCAGSTVPATTAACGLSAAACGRFPGSTPAAGHDEHTTGGGGPVRPSATRAARLCGTPSCSCSCCSSWAGFRSAHACSNGASPSYY